VPGSARRPCRNLTAEVGPPSSVNAFFHGLHPAPTYDWVAGRARFGAWVRVPAGKAERPPSLQLGDLRADARQRARLTEIGYANSYGTAALAYARGYSAAISVLLRSPFARGTRLVIARGDAGLENWREIRQMSATKSKSRRLSGGR
jgi:hypothetical protein